MLKLLASSLVIVAAAAWVGAATNHGCQDVRTSFTKLSYSPIRDMRRTVAILPQKVSMRLPDSLSVPIGGREEMPDPAVLMANRATIAARYVDSTAADDSSMARGERMFSRLCTPCHGAQMQGNGPVAARFMPPPDLLGATTRGRTDGYIYTYIRFGGAIMPKYGHALTQAQTWDVIHYLRQRQKVSPR
jgi:S-disulfanyl-L-cysteine oxidoreductase SoxD